MQRFGGLTHFKALLLIGVLTQLTACRLREGEHCLCADDCRGGLACVTDQGALDPGTCVTDDTQSSVDPQSGVCLDQGEQAGGQAPEVRPPLPWDTSKRDLPLVGDDAGSSSSDPGDENTGTASSEGAESTRSGTGTESGETSEDSGSTSGRGESSTASVNTDALSSDPSESTTADLSESTTADPSESTTAEGEMSSSSSASGGGAL